MGVFLGAHGPYGLHGKMSAYSLINEEYKKLKKIPCFFNDRLANYAVLEHSVLPSMEYVMV
jgi:hypothetical protein